MATLDNEAAGKQAEGRRGLSWGTMLALVALAIAVAAGCAYLLVAPFFHLPAR